MQNNLTECNKKRYKGILLETKVREGTKVLYIANDTDCKTEGYPVNEYELLLSNKVKYKIEKSKKVK